MPACTCTTHHIQSQLDPLQPTMHAALYACVVCGMQMPAHMCACHGMCACQQYEKCIAPAWACNRSTVSKVPVPWHQACPSAAAAVPPATTNEQPAPPKHGHTPARKKGACMDGAVLRGVKKARPTTKGEWGSMCNSYSPVQGRPHKVAD